jgi:hypothetical protein
VGKISLNGIEPLSCLYFLFASENTLEPTERINGFESTLGLMLMAPNRSDSIFGYSMALEPKGFESGSGMLSCGLSWAALKLRVLLLIKLRGSKRATYSGSMN